MVEYFINNCNIRKGRCRNSLKYKNITDMHTHSIHSFDGNDSCLALCDSAYQKGTLALAITDHCDIDGEDINVDTLCQSQLADIEECSRKYHKKLKVLKGLEIGQGIYRREETERLLDTYSYDFILGSLHNLENKQDFYFLDYSKYDVYSLLGKYFDDLLCLCEWGAFDSLAHLTYPLRYIVAREKINVDMSKCSDVIDEIFLLLAKNDKALEINTSGLFMDMHDTLPNISLVKRFKQLGGKFVTIGSDSHYAKKVCCGIEEGMDIAKESGFECITVFVNRQPMMFPIR